MVTITVTAWKLTQLIAACQWQSRCVIMMMLPVANFEPDHDDRPASGSAGIIIMMMID